MTTKKVMAQNFNPEKQRLGLALLVEPLRVGGHLGEWLRHHASLGIRTFWICLPKHSSCIQAPTGPLVATIDGANQADIELRSRHQKANRQIRKTIKRSNDIYGINASFLRIKPSASKDLKTTLLTNLAARAQKEVDWIGLLEIDELLVGKMEALHGLPNSTRAIALSKRLFASRYFHGQRRPMSGIHSYHVSVPEKTVTLIRPHSLLPIAGCSNSKDAEEISPPSSVLRVHQFRGVSGRKRCTKTTCPSTDQAHQARFDVIVGTMRSGSTLLGHVLTSLQWGRYVGETHVRLDSEVQILKAIHRIDKQLGCRIPLHLPAIDKIIHKRHWANDAFLHERVGAIYLLHRHPAPVWRSLKKTNWRFGTLDYLITHYQWLIEIATKIASKKLQAVCYYDLVDPVRFEKKFGAPGGSYELLPTSGKGNWGDPYNLIKSGKIATREEDAEIQEAMRQFDPLPEKLQACIALYQQLKALVEVRTCDEH